jgi:ankyrin repeat protein
LEEDDTSPDFFTIDFIAWDSKCSALHFAILSGNVEAVKLLCLEYGADILDPVKLGSGDSYYDSKTAILTLVLALALPVDAAAHMAATLLDLGATAAQADVHGVSAFHRYVQRGDSRLINTLWDNDKAGLKVAINHVTLGSNHWNPNATSPLMTAIDKGDPILVLRLLEAGANPEVDFDSWLKGAKLSFESRLRDLNHNTGMWKDSTEQPLIVALRSIHPGSALELLERGADPNTITKASHNVIRNEYVRRYQKGQSALDIVRDSLKTLRGYEGEKVSFATVAFKENGCRTTFADYVKAPDGPKGIVAELSKYREGTFQYWAVSNDAKGHLEAHAKRVEEFNKEMAKLTDQHGVTEKRTAIKEAIAEYERIEVLLLRKGGKTFRELNPHIQDSSSTSSHESDDASKTEGSNEYRYHWTVQGTKDDTPARHAAYIEL